MLPNQDFFYTFDDLGDEPTPAAIRRACPDGARRQHAFAHFRDRHPSKVEYVLGYVDAYARNGVYDDEQFAHCFEQVEAGLQLDNRKDCHAKLSALRSDLQREQAEFHAEFGPEPPADPSRPWFQFRAGHFDGILSRFAELQESVKPRGILGPPEEKEYWALFQFAIRISLANGNIARGIELMDGYESGRIAVRLTPMPDCDLQEAILGYHAKHDVACARKRLQFWLDNSRMPTVSDLISRHPLFAELCCQLAP